MVDVIRTLVVEAGKKCLAFAQLRLGYYWNYDGNFENLKAEMVKLKDESTSFQRRVSEAKAKGEEVEEKVEKWLVSANKIIDEAARSIEDEDKTNNRCLMGLCPNLMMTRCWLSKKAETEGRAIVELREEAGRFHRFSYRTIPEEIWLKSRKGYEAFESRLSTLTGIQNALTDPNVSIVGAYGMGGIGKTTLVKEVARQVKEDKLFDQVVFSEVSQTIDVKKIQGEIAEKLGLVLQEEAESRRASRLYERLKNEKKILVVLDNIWKYLDLDTVGIPSGDDRKGCKVLLTARDHNVLLSMGSKDNYSIGVLNEEEAWRLFKIMAGEDVESCQLKSTATEVARACGGLPIALTTIARALRNKSVHEWKNALQELRTPSVVNFEGVPAEAYSTIELSYKYLKGEQLKKTFLLCSLITPASIMDLLKYGMGLSIFRGVFRLEDARNKLLALVHQLKDSCLLIQGDSSHWFFMHDVVRDVAISIACRDQNVFSVRNEDVWGWPDEDALKKCSAISCMDSNICEVLEGLKCPQLEFLHIFPNDSSAEINIPKNFFIWMRKLRVVVLTRMQLFSLPSSIEFLVNLQTLCLDQSRLGDIAIIGNLKNLEILSFVNSDLVHVPEELAQLTKLRLLDLTDCFHLKVIAPNVISRLTRLEELYMRNCFVEWEQVEGPKREISNASLDELMHLHRLATLEIDVKDDNILPDKFFTRKLEMFKMSIGDGLFNRQVPLRISWFEMSRPHFMIANSGNLRTLKLKFNFKLICSKKLQGIKNVEYLCLDKLQGAKNVLFELDTEGFSQLKHLLVQNNPDFLCIVDSFKKVSCDVFPLLESLILYNLINLERICIDGLKVESFYQLRIIKVENCDELSNVFLLSTTKSLPRLERIAAINCRNMEEILTTDGEVDAHNNNAIEKIEFAQLRYLSLGRLPKLTNFCCEVKTPFSSPNRQDLQEEVTAITLSNELKLEDKLDTPTPLLSEKVILPNLEVLDLYQINVETIWHDQFPVMFPPFQSLTRLTMWSCNKLKYVFLASMIRSFGQLQHLEILRCRSLQEIISKEGIDQVTPCFVFPRVTTLILTNLPELRCLYPGMHTSEWPALKRFEGNSCNKIKIFTSELIDFHINDEMNQLHIPAQHLFLFEKIVPNLVELKLSAKDLAMIWQVDCPPDIFGTLKRLIVVSDDSASFPLGLLERFHNLESLVIICCSYVEIFSKVGHFEKHVGKPAKMRTLNLYTLNHLKQLLKEPDSELISIIQCIEILRVHYCNNLVILLPPFFVSFQNLTRLEVVGCPKLMNLVTLSAARSLVRLVTMKVIGCSAMTQVVTSQGDSDADAAAKEEIVFSKLKKMVLYDLESLTSFCSDNCAFKFPSLEDIDVIGCPKMKIFTTAYSSTQPSVKVLYDEGAGIWRRVDELNTTIQQLHDEKLLVKPSSYLLKWWDN